MQKPLLATHWRFRKRGQLREFLKRFSEAATLISELDHIRKRYLLGQGCIMPQLNTSETVRTRLHQLIERLVAFANGTLPEYETLHDKISTRWIEPETAAPKLIVKTEIRFLAQLAFGNSAAKTKSHLKQDLKTLQTFLQRLEDNRDRTQGSVLWHFTLTLWSRDISKNLSAFNAEWQQRKHNKPAEVKNVATAAIAALPTTESPQPTSPLQPHPTPLLGAVTSPPALQQNLPSPGYSTFVGRENNTQQLLTWLMPNHPAARINITGIAGIGKTTLALVAARQCLGTSTYSLTHGSTPTFSAIIFTSARSQQFTPQGILPRSRYSHTLQDILRAIALTLQQPSILTGDLSQQIEAIYLLLAQQHTLLIVDDLPALSEQQPVLSFLYDLPATVKVIVTSRIQMPMDATIMLGGLSFQATARLVAAHQSQQQRSQLEAHICRQIYERTDGIPAAIEYALGQLAVGYPLSSVLPQLTLKATDYCRFYLESALRPIKQTAAYTLLLALSLFPAPASQAALKQAAQTSEEETIEGLVELQRRSLITSESNKLAMLTLTQEYVVNERSPAFELSVRERQCQWYSHWLKTFATANWRAWQDYTALDAEWETLAAVVEWSLSTDCPAAFGQLWSGLRGYTYLRGYWRQRLAWLEKWLAIAQQNNSASDIYQALQDLSWTLALMGKPDQLKKANDYLQQAWQSRQAQSPQAKLDLAIEQIILSMFQNNLAAANRWLKKAQSLLETHLLGKQLATQQQARLSYYQAQWHYRTGNLKQAKAVYQQLLKQAHLKEDIQTEVYTLNWLVDIALEENDLTTARTLLLQSWPVVKTQADLRSLGFHQRSQAKLANLSNNTSEFEYWAQQAKKTFATLGMQPQEKELHAWLTTQDIPSR